MNFRDVPSPFGLGASSRGFTLVELMIVVALIGILAAIGLVSFNTYIDDAKLTELRQYAMDIERGQEQYFSRHHEYFEPDDNVYSVDEGTLDDEEWNQLLEFNEQVPADVEIEVEAHDDGGGGTCGICPANPGEDIWFGVRARNDGLDKDVFIGTGFPEPMEVDTDQ